MKTKMEIIKVPEYIDEHSCDRCGACHKNIMGGSNYVQYGPKYGKINYHLTCFNKKEKRNLKTIKICEENLKSNLLKLENFKHNIMCKDKKSIKIIDTVKKITNFAVKIHDNKFRKLVCYKCDDHILQGNVYINYGSSIKRFFHLQCFQNYVYDRLKYYSTCKKEVQEHLDELEPYKNEMICESLEQN